MVRIASIVGAMRANPAGVRFADLCRVCEHYFGDARQAGTSHRVYWTPWPGDPRVNIQEGKGGKAKAYKVRQVMRAIDRLSGASNAE